MLPGGKDCSGRKGCGIGELHGINGLPLPALAPHVEAVSAPLKASPVAQGSSRCKAVLTSFCAESRVGFARVVAKLAVFFEGAVPCKFCGAVGNLILTGDYGPLPPVVKASKPYAANQGALVALGNVAHIVEQGIGGIGVGRVKGIPVPAANGNQGQVALAVNLVHHAHLGILVGGQHGNLK